MRTLELCGSKPNCVCSFNSESDKSYIKPIQVSETPLPKIKEIFNKLNIKVKSEESNYIHGVDTTRILRFKDDVEFLYDDELKTLHMKSKSRVGRSDLGTNRRRLTKILSMF